MSRPSAPALARLERILLMVPWLLERPGIHVDEVTQRFAISAEELAADLDVLGYCGLPGYGGGDLVEAVLIGDCVTVRMASFFARPLRLSVREAVTLLLAARALASVQELTESAALSAAVAKLEGLLGATAAGPSATSSVAIDLRAEGDEHLALLRQAIADRRLIQLGYRSGSKAQTTQRDVEPVALIGSGGAWYLHGWCRLAQGPRDFRLDRIQQVEVTSQRIAPRPQPVAAPVYVPADDDIEVELELDRPAWWFADQVVCDQITEAGETLRLTLRTPQLDWLAARLLALGAAARILRPDALHLQVAARCDAVLRRYADTDPP